MCVCVTVCMCLDLLLVLFGRVFGRRYETQKRGGDRNNTGLSDYTAEREHAVLPRAD